MADGYMTEDEFKRVVEELTLKVYGNIYGQIDFSKVTKWLKLAPPQRFYDVSIKTREDIERHIGDIYVKCVDEWRECPRLGEHIVYDPPEGIRANFPQYITHPIFGKKQANTVWDLTPRKLGIHALCITSSDCNAEMYELLSIWRFKQHGILAAIPKEIDTTYTVAKPEIDPALAEFIDIDGLTKMIELYMNASLDKYKQQRQRQLDAVRAQLLELEAEMISVLEKIPCSPKFISPTNLADVPFCALLE